VIVGFDAYSSVKGVISPRGAPYVIVPGGGGNALVPLDAFGKSRQHLLAQLAHQGVIIAGPKSVSKLLDRVSDLSEFGPLPMVDVYGWNGVYFVLPHRQIVMPEGAPEPLNAVPSSAGWAADDPIYRESSTPEKLKLLGLLKDEPVLRFIVMAALMPLLLRLIDHQDNFGFEFAGGDETGLQALKAVAGGVWGDSSTHDFQQVIKDRYGTLAAHNDLPVLIDGGDLLFASESTRQQVACLKTFARGLRGSAGTGNQRSFIDIRTTFLSFASKPMYERVSGELDLIQALGDTVISLTPPMDDGASWLAATASGLDGALAFRHRLERAAHRDAGRLGRSFAQRVVNEHAVDPKALKKRIRQHIEEFRTAVQGVRGLTSERIKERFGLVYAAGALAHGYGLLPGSGLLAVVQCAERYHRPFKQPIPFEDVLRELATKADTVHIEGNGKGASAEQIAAGRVFIFGSGAEAELIIRPEHIDDEIPDWRKRRRQPDCHVWIKRDDEEHIKPKRVLVKGEKPKRVHCFRLPDGAID
jgi:hypothetical protein